jgi:hypothetical protein
MKTRLFSFLALALVGAQAFAEPAKPVGLQICEPTALIVAEAFDRPEAVAKGKGGQDGWRVGNGQWEVRDGVLHGDEKEADHHAAGLTWRAEFTDAVITAQFRLGGAEQIAFGCRDTIAPNHHLGRVFITPSALWVQKMSGIAKTTKSEKLKQRDTKFDPEAWYDITIEISGEHYRARVGEHVIEAQHARFKDAKGIVALIVKGQGAQFKNVAIWKALPKG